MFLSHIRTLLFRLSWIFNVFDEDGGGSIDVEEVHKLVLSLLQLTEAGDMGEESVQACIQVSDTIVIMGERIKRRFVFTGDNTDHGRGW